MQGHFDSNQTDLVPGAATSSTPSTLDEVLTVLRALLPGLRERYGVESLGVFGSFARGEQRPDSDVDVLVTFGRSAGLFDLAGVWLELTERLRCRVDVVSRGGLKQRFAERVANDLVSV